MKTFLGVTVPFVLLIAVVALARQADNPIDAFLRHDYLRAIDLAESRLKSSTTGGGSAQYYCLLGMSYLELGMYEKAQLYLKQTLLLAGEDSTYKQAARAALMKSEFSDFQAKPSTSLRRELFAIVSNFRASNLSSVWPTDDRAVEAANRRTAETISSELSDIAGDWIDDFKDKLCPFCTSTRYRVLRKDGETWMTNSEYSSSSSHLSLLTALTGKLTGEHGMFAGKLTGNVASTTASSVESLRVSLDVRVQVEPDGSGMVITASYGSPDGRFGMITGPMTEVIPRAPVTRHFRRVEP